MNTEETETEMSPKSLYHHIMVIRSKILNDRIDSWLKEDMRNACRLRKNTPAKREALRAELLSAILEEMEKTIRDARKVKTCVPTKRHNAPHGIRRDLDAILASDVIQQKQTKDGFEFLVSVRGVTKKYKISNSPLGLLLNYHANNTPWFYHQRRDDLPVGPRSCGPRPHHKHYR